MAKFLLQKYPEVLLGGGSREMCTERCSAFWEKFKGYQPEHRVFSDFGTEQLSRVIPIAMHGDKGRTLKKSPIAVYSWESIWGLPAKLRDLDLEPRQVQMQGKKYDHGRLGQTCGERGSADTDCAFNCTIKRRRVGETGEWIETHNSLGHLSWYSNAASLFCRFGM